jgi:hypothetical protein
MILRSSFESETTVTKEVDWYMHDVLLSRLDYLGVLAGRKERFLEEIGAIIGRSVCCSKSHC